MRPQIGHAVDQAELVAEATSGEAIRSNADSRAAVSGSDQAANHASTASPAPARASFAVTLPKDRELVAPALHVLVAHRGLREGVRQVQLGAVGMLGQPIVTSEPPSGMGVAERYP